jgi:hypothetical protein
MAGRATTPTVDADAAADAQATSPAAAAAASSKFLKFLKPAKYFQWNEQLDFLLRGEGGGAKVLVELEVVLGARRLQVKALACLVLVQAHVAVA